MVHLTFRFCLLKVECRAGMDQPGPLQRIGEEGHFRDRPQTISTFHWSWAVGKTGGKAISLTPLFSPHKHRAQVHLTSTLSCNKDCWDGQEGKPGRKYHLKSDLTPPVFPKCLLCFKACGKAIFSLKTKPEEALWVMVVNNRSMVRSLPQTPAGLELLSACKDLNPSSFQRGKRSSISLCCRHCSTWQGVIKDHLDHRERASKSALNLWTQSLAQRRSPGVSFLLQHLFA